MELIRTRISWSVYLAAILNAVAAIEKAGNMVCPVYVVLSVVDVHPMGVRLANY